MLTKLEKDLPRLEQKNNSYFAETQSPFFKQNRCFQLKETCCQDK